jgi:hypothetical protein
MLELTASRSTGRPEAPYGRAAAVLRLLAALMALLAIVAGLRFMMGR